jgi:hypothetical protein
LNLGGLGVAQRERKRGRWGGFLVTGVVGEDELYLAFGGQVNDFQGGGQTALLELQEYGTTADGPKSDALGPLRLGRVYQP